MRNFLAMTGWILALTFGAEIRAQSNVISKQETMNQVLTPQQADRDFTAFFDFEKTPPPNTPEAMGPANYLKWYQQMLMRINLAGLTVYQSYPTDPRRWEVVAALLNNPPMFAKEIPDDVGTRGIGAIVVDENAKAAWTAKAAQLRRALVSASDAAPTVKETVDWGAFVREFKIAAQGLQQGAKVNWAAFTSQLDRHVAKYGALKIAVARAADYISALKKIAPDEAALEWQHLQQSPDPLLQARAKSEVKVAAALQAPFALKFTSLDGREVDLTKLHGKVVMVDYWAPDLNTTLTEFPNVQALYRLYHDKGLEIIGVPMAPESDRTLVSGFVKTRKVAWPQDFDGRGAETEAAADYGVAKAPYRFLLDQNGKIVATNPSLRDLNALVKKLLGM